MRYEPRLDAYRAVCITLVFLAHWAVLDCGWIGVQAFFVLSGYLITGILRAEREATESRAYFTNFYARRALRIFPLYFAYVFVLLAAARVSSSHISLYLDGIVSPSLPYLLSYTYNFYRIIAGTSNPFLGHLWSLSVEEHFYIFWPLAVYILPPKRLLWLSVFAIAAAPFVRFAELEFQLLTGFASSKDAGHLIYLFSASHVDAFAFGALLTFRHESVRVQRVLPLLSKWVPILFAASAVWMLLLGRIAAYPLNLSSLGWPIYLPYFYAYAWGYTLLNALFFVVLANIDRLKAIADVRALQRLGKVSYGFYIFHNPIINLTKYLLDDPYSSAGFHDAFCFFLAFGTSWIAAELSFRFFEAPIMKLKAGFARSGNGIIALSSVQPTGIDTR